MSSKNKFILENFNNDGTSTKTEYKTLRDISQKIGPSLEYNHQIRSIYLQSKKETKLHPQLAEIYKQIHISDNPASKVVLNFTVE